MNHADRLSVVDSHIERVPNQFGAHVGGHCPPHDPTEDIQHDGNEQEVRKRLHVGDVRDVQFVGSIGDELALDEIRRRPASRRVVMKALRRLAP